MTQTYLGVQIANMQILILFPFPSLIQAHMCPCSADTSVHMHIYAYYAMFLHPNRYKCAYHSLIMRPQRCIWAFMRISIFTQYPCISCNINASKQMHHTKLMQNWMFVLSISAAITSSMMQKGKNILVKCGHFLSSNPYYITRDHLVVNFILILASSFKISSVFKSWCVLAMCMC